MDHLWLTGVYNRPSSLKSHMCRKRVATTYSGLDAEIHAEWIFMYRAYLTHFSYRCWFLNCTNGEEGVREGEGHRKGWALKTPTMHTEWHLLRSLPFQGLNSLDFQGPILQWPSKRICPHQNHYVPRHITNSSIKVILSPKATPAINSGWCVIIVNKSAVSQIITALFIFKNSFVRV